MQLSRLEESSREELSVYISCCLHPQRENERHTSAHTHILSCHLALRH